MKSCGSPRLPSPLWSLVAGGLNSTGKEEEHCIQSEE